MLEWIRRGNCDGHWLEVREGGLREGDGQKDLVDISNLGRMHDVILHRSCRDNVARMMTVLTS